MAFMFGSLVLGIILVLVRSFVFFSVCLLVSSVSYVYLLLNLDRVM